MRSIFITLVIANVAVLAYFWFGQKAESGAVEVAAPVEVVSPRAQSLVLLDELERERLDGMVEAKQRIQFQAQAEVDALAEQYEAMRNSGEGELPDSARPESAGPMCTYVGPFKAMLPAEYFAEHLSALEVQADVQRVEVPGEPSFWVYQAPESSRKAALRKLHELQAKGIDSYVIPKGELENGISFGLYNQLDSAEGRLELVQKAGYKAEVRRVDRTFEEIWVSLESQEAAKVGQELWFELMNREDGLEKRQNFCPAVASN